MSFEAIKWAFEQKTTKATEKYVLIALANRANKESQLWASVNQICDDTQLNRKTVIACLKSLVFDGLVKDTGKRKGGTGQVKVYELLATVQSVKSPKNGTLKESQNEPTLPAKTDPKTGQLNSPKTGTLTNETVPKTGRLNDTKNGTVKSERVPKTDTKSPKNGTLKEYQKRDTEPVSIRTSKEPVNILFKNLDFSSWPELPDEQIFKDWQAARKSKKAPITQTVISGFGTELSKASKHGFTVNQCLQECCIRNWQGFKAEWLIGKAQPNNKYSGFDKIDYEAQAKAEGFNTDLRI